MKNFQFPYLGTDRVFFISTLTFLLIAFGVALVVGPAASSAAASNVTAAAPFCTTDTVVVNNLDSGAGSLRQAIADACDGSTITFDMAQVISPISLTTAQLVINKNLTITGPGSASLTIERNAAQATPQFRIFNISISATTVNISGLTITNGHAPDGAAGGFIGGAGSEGGGIRNVGTLVMSDVRVTGNQSGNGGAADSLVGNGGKGGGIYNENGTMTMTNCVVSGNRSGDAGTGQTGQFGHGGDGAGIFSQGGTATMTSVSISGNTGGNSTALSGFGGIGAGLYIASPGTVSMTRSVVSNNSAGDATGNSGTPGYAGGIFTEGSLTMTGSTISGNSTKSSGGGIMNRGGAVLRLMNSTVSGNSASFDGSAIYNDINGFLFLTNCTITNNSSQGLGAVLINSQTVEVRNTIIAANGLKDISGNFISRGNNIIGVQCVNGIFSCAGFTNGVNGDQVGTEEAPLNPGLGPLANNGGPTQTHALLSNSPALDAGDSCVLDNSCSPAVGQSLTTDQRGAGFPRAADSADADTTATVDIGAFEAQASVEDIPNKSTAEDTPISFSFNIGDAAAVTTVTASSANPALVPNSPVNLNVTGSGSTRTLNITPAANLAGLAVITVAVSTATDSMSDTFVLTVNSVADTPSVTNATTNEDTQTSSGLVVTRNAADNGEVSHFRVSAITNGALFKSNGTTQLNNGDFITVAEGNAGLKFSPATNLFSPGTSFGFSVEAALSANGAGLSPATSATITVQAVADLPTVTNASTFVDTQTTSGLVITRNAVDGVEITHFKITNITNGTLFKNDGTTLLTNNTFITSAEAGAGLRFTPTLNLSSPSSTFSFQVQGATNASGAGLGAAATASITVAKVTPTISLTSSVNPSSFGQPVKFTVNVTSGSGTPTGTVQFKDGGSNLGSAQSLTNGTAQLTIANLTSGTHVITADYGGDTTFNSGSATLAGGQTVNATPTLSINDVSITEGTAGSTNLVFTVTLSASSGATISVDYAAADGTAQTSDNDYQSASGTLTFNPGEVTKTITLVINGDQKTENDETVFINLNNPVNAVVADAQGAGTILNDDTLQLLLDESGPAVNQAAALETLLFLRDPFRVDRIEDWPNLIADRNTRIMLFAANLTLNQGEPSAAVTVTLMDSNNQTFTLPAEDVRVATNTSFAQVIVRLPDNVAAGVCLVTINVHGQTSNTGSIRIAQ